MKLLHFSLKQAQRLLGLTMILAVLLPVLFGLSQSYYWTYAVILSICLGTFYIFLYPKYSTHPEIEAARLQQVKAVKKIKASKSLQYIRTIQVVATSIILALIILSVISKKYLFLEMAVPLIVFIVMLYLSKLYQRIPGTQQYGKQLEAIQRQGVQRSVRARVIGVLLSIIIITIFYLWFSYRSY